MKILFLYNNELALRLAEWLRKNQNEVILWKERLDIELLKKVAPDKIISYSYRYLITKEVIDFIPTSILNLHVSYLPWNRGANPNFWSFIDDTPKGVTIHEIDENLDKGKILLQRMLDFDEETETFATTYQKLNEEIVSLFMENSEELLQEKIEGVKAEGAGSYHSVTDFVEYTKHNAVKWDDKIAEYKRRIEGEDDGLHTN